MPRKQSEIENLAKVYGHRLSDLFDNIEIRLFGSYLNGNPNKWSDIDFAVVSRDFSDIVRVTGIKILNKLASKIADDIEAIPVDPRDLIKAAPGTIEYEISKNSKILYP